MWGAERGERKDEDGINTITSGQKTRAEKRFSLLGPEGVHEKWILNFAASLYVEGMNQQAKNDSNEKRPDFQALRHHKLI